MEGEHIAQTVACHTLYRHWYVVGALTGALHLSKVCVQDPGGVWLASPLRTSIRLGRPGHGMIKMSTDSSNFATSATSERPLRSRLTFALHL